MTQALRKIISLSLLCGGNIKKRNMYFFLGERALCRPIRLRLLGGGDYAVPRYLRALPTQLPAAGGALRGAPPAALPAQEAPDPQPLPTPRQPSAKPAGERQSVSRLEPSF